jgi:anti-sigma factor RsiW
LRGFGAVRAFAAIAAFLVIGASLWAVSTKLVDREVLPSFAEMAVDSHRRHALGQLPLEVRTQVSTEISEWFQDKVPFTLQLPNYQDTSGQEKLYLPVGARLVGFNGDYAAYVSYRMEDHLISLIVTSRSAAAPTGTHTITSKGIDFYYDTISDLKVITWSHRSLTYALVSDLEERGQQSCLVCHQGAKEQDFMTTLTLPLPQEQIVKTTRM